MEQKRKIEKLVERIRKLEAVAHIPVDWEVKIDELAKKVNKLVQLITKGENYAK